MNNLPFDDEGQPFTKEEITDIVYNLRETLSKYEKMEATVDLVAAKQKKLEHRKLREADRLDKQVSVNFPLWLYDILEREIVPIMREKVELRRADFCLSHALRYLGYFALKYPGLIKAVSLAELKAIYKEDPS
jgi:hypothetical protein